MRRSLLITLDAILFALAVLVWSIRLTGLNVHEWLGLSFSVLLIVHIVWHWNWLTFTVQRLRMQGAWRARINFLLNFALFAVTTLTIYSGVVIFVAPKIGGNTGHTWDRVHSASQNLMMLVLGLHLALNWRWIMKLGVQR